VWGCGALAEFSQQLLSLGYNELLLQRGHMALRVARGLFRIWVVASIVWLVGWLWYVWATCKTDNERLLYCYTSFFDDWMQRGDFTFWYYAKLIATGMVVPIVVLALGSALVWAFKGFR
jgi:hypothetical protein